MKCFHKLRQLLFIVLISNNIYSQALFKHVEESAGFGQIRENNGVAVADYDGDLDLDIFIVAKAKDQDGIDKSHSKLFRNNGDGTFTDVTLGSGLENLLEFDELGPKYDSFLGLAGYKFGVSWGDYDNDGDPDIFFTHRTKVQLFRNEGNGTFTNITAQSGIQGKNGCSNTGATWFDYNNDSFLDIYISDWNGCSSSTLYKNNGDGTFTDVTEATNIKTTGLRHSYAPMPYDFNKDGWLDLYVSVDFNNPNHLFINNNGNTFTEEASIFGVNTFPNDMGVAIADYDKDGLFDIFITAINNNFLLTNNGNGSFTDLAEEKFVKNSQWGWGTKFADFDHDGDEDLIVVNGFEISVGSQRNVYYENIIENNNQFFSEENSQGLDETTISVEALDFDYDNDGDLDLFISNSDGPSFFYKNTSFYKAINERFKWFKVQLQGTISNRDAVGTTITITTNDDTLKRYYSGVGFLGQSIKPVHFGLKNANEIKELKIEWPSGHIDVYIDLDVNTFIRAVENQNYEVLNMTPPDEILGCTDPNSCNYNPNATINDDSCVYRPINDNISGETNANYFSTETYTYPLENGTTINWKVEGGEIVDDSINGSVTIKWGIEEQGKIAATLYSNQCSSEEISINVILGLSEISEDKSVARLWNEVLLEAIRGDYARPTVHARNLFHTSIAMYDAWAIYSDMAKPYLIGNNVNGFSSKLLGFKPLEETVEISRTKAISYAVYRLLSHRFKNSPSTLDSQRKFNLLMRALGYDINYTDMSYEVAGDAAALGNFIAKTIIDYGNLDGAREETGYDNQYYLSVNQSLAPIVSGNPSITDPNRWQSLSLDVFIDQSGNLIDQSAAIDFLSPEWGNVWPFALTDNAKSQHQRNGNTYNVYHNPSPPPYIGSPSSSDSDAYKLGFSMVSIWGSHLDPSDGVLWDISPRAIGNIPISSFPTSYQEYPNFYKLIEGGDIGSGYTINPKTGIAYEPQIVPRGDYTRVLAEFWADGPDSETPPGHWFTILNYVNDHSLFEKKFEGEGSSLDDLEWDVKSYFIMGGAMHDTAISAWSIKGWYDYIRPISAIRYMTDLGQSTDMSLPNYHEDGIPLRDGYVEQVKLGDPLAGLQNEHINKIKLYTWKGHEFISDPSIDQAGVGWILAENWWPYQRPSFVTPPFAGFVSGHSTYSRAAAEVMTLLTGDAYFPGGIGEFVARKNEFLVFEEGPSEDIILQWATYRDASDQCSLSRIWGGIHPPADDIPGRLIGEKIGIDTFSFAKSFFDGKKEGVIVSEDTKIFPNPIEALGEITIYSTNENDLFSFFDIKGTLLPVKKVYSSVSKSTKVSIGNLSSGIYILTDGNGRNWKILVK